MSKEELEKEAIAKYKTGSYPQLHPDHYAFIHGYLAGAEPREKRIEELKSIAEFQQSSNMKRHFEILELKKENAEMKRNNLFLNNLVREKEQRGLEIQEDLLKENAELKGLRCCENCKNVNLQLHWRESEEIDKRRQFVCGTCGNRKHWEYSGKTVGITETQQLTKAKEIIKDLLLVAKVEHLKDRYETVEEAEQFLKEIEK